MTGLGAVGLALVGVSALVVAAAGLAVVLPAGLRLRRTAAVTERLIADYREGMGAELWRLRQAELERAMLLRPVRRVRRWLGHPLTIALLESYARRRDRGREAARA